MLLAPEQAQFMVLLTRLLGVRRYLEIGTYTGYSALAALRASPSPGGRRFWSSLLVDRRNAPHIYSVPRKERPWRQERQHDHVSQRRLSPDRI